MYGHTDLLVAFVGGLLIATITAPIGVSGAVLLLPFQVTVLAAPSPAVTPTNLVFNVLSVPGALARYRREGSLKSSLTALLLAGTLPGVIVGAYLRVHLVPEGTVFRLLVAFLLLPLGVSLIVRTLRPAPKETPQRPARTLKPLPLVAFSLCVGVIGGVYGIGGGSLLAPALVALGSSPRIVAPAALTSTFVTSCVGVATYELMARIGEAQAAPVWGIAIAAGLGGLVGGYVGAALQPHAPVRLLTGGLGVVTIAVSLSYIGAVV